MLTKSIVLVPALMIFVVMMISRRTLPSLIAGIVTAAVIQGQSIGFSTIYTIFSYFQSVFYESSQISWNNIFTLLFLWVLGIIISVYTYSGAMSILAERITKYIKSPTYAKLIVFFLGIICFIDDYFNSLAIGSSARTLFDKKSLSREKLAYYLDTTAAPVCVMVPLSSWGAFIVAILDSSIFQFGLPYTSGVELFLQSVCYNYYSIISLIMLFIFSIWNFDFPKMLYFENQAKNNNNDSPATSMISSKLVFYSIPVSVMVLFASTLLFMFATGYIYSDSVSFISILSNMKLGFSLFCGGTLSLICFLIFCPINYKDLVLNLSEGYKTMSSAIYVLVFAWAFSFAMNELNVGDYIASVIISSNFHKSYIPIVIFFTAVMISICTGSSWVTFAVLIPIICQLLINDINILPMTIGAMLAGGVFGDHTSPISDTSILSSIGAGCSHLDHVITQLPYNITALILSTIIYVISVFLY
ncbi:Na+/H+ antiporter NhaC family protein [Rickettsia endosymbiont of Cardiosporidium cionae]|uniref:Na+/H+ antiporter NhaC family protein n=1 Tax=Rickettsia endosymbiont of Cardiosporidium cionae TaxID=2777155 RepID=UPI0018955336|nr:Na+/H+ antiporter NhaC family protein [Rickettsia endosymbiont of Cardiosporidium cionae]KAF8818658.1 hypothetical protein IHI24_000380 [Rickettsia endosymbiont of Cardiosporidium cionae]